jgi:CheY-like chemotaxis protein
MPTTPTSHLQALTADADVATVLQAALPRLRFRLDLCTTVAALQQRYAAQHPDVLLVDLDLGDEIVGEALALLRDRFCNDWAPVVLLCRSAAAGERLARRLPGAINFLIVKPLTEAALVERRVALRRMSVPGRAEVARAASKCTGRTMRARAACASGMAKKRTKAPARNQPRTLSELGSGRPLVPTPHSSSRGLSAWRISMISTSSCIVPARQRAFPPASAKAQADPAGPWPGAGRLTNRLHTAANRPTALFFGAVPTPQRQSLRQVLHPPEAVAAHRFTASNTSRAGARDASDDCVRE